MKIKINSTKKIESELERIENGCRARLFDIGRIEEAIEGAEEKLTELDIPKKAWLGCSILLDAGRVANCYNGQAYGTQITIERFPSGWFVVGMERARVKSASGGHWPINVLFITDAAKIAMPSNYSV